jgi:hypothetical protein
MNKKLFIFAIIAMAMLCGQAFAQRAYLLNSFSTSKENWWGDDLTTTPARTLTGGNGHLTWSLFLPNASKSIGEDTANSLIGHDHFDVTGVEKLVIHDVSYVGGPTSTTLQFWIMPHNDWNWHGPEFVLERGKHYDLAYPLSLLSPVEKMHMDSYGLQPQTTSTLYGSGMTTFTIGYVSEVNPSTTRTVATFANTYTTPSMNLQSVGWSGNNGDSHTSRTQSQLNITALSGVAGSVDGGVAACTLNTTNTWPAIIFGTGLYTNSISATGGFNWGVYWDQYPMDLSNYDRLRVRARVTTPDAIYMLPWMVTYKAAGGWTDGSNPATNLNSQVTIPGGGAFANYDFPLEVAAGAGDPIDLSKVVYTGLKVAPVSGTLSTPAIIQIDTIQYYDSTPPLPGVNKAKSWEMFE